MNKNITCEKCGKILKGRQTKFCSTVCKNDYYQSYITQQARGLKRKLALIQQLGGQCVFCGYKKNSSALDLHHVKPQDKCILLCRNCHSELHNPQHNLE